MSDNRSIIRISKNRNNPYTIINNTSLRDKNLSWKAKGLLAYLLSLPDDWQIYESEVVNHSTDGKASLASGMQELIDSKYIHRNRKRNKKGHFKGYEYVVYEVPTETRKPENGKPENGKPENGKSDTTKYSPNEVLNKLNTNYNNSDGGKFQEIVQAFQNNGFGLMNATTKDKLVDLVGTYTDEWVLEAIDIAVMQNKRNLAYVNGILKKWQADGKDSGTSQVKSKSTNSWQVDAT